MPQVNAAFARQAFHTLNQKTGETIQQFATRLRQAPKDCGFQADTDNQIRDAILSKCTSDYVRRKLLEEGPTLTLARSVELASQCERIEEQMSVISLRPDTGTVNQVVQKRDKREKGSKGYTRNKHAERKYEKVDRKYYRCGHKDHLSRDQTCPARGQVCHICNGKDHFSKMCHTKNPKKNRVNNVEEAEYAFLVQEKTMSEKLTVLVGGVKLRLLIDSGATNNVIDEDTWEDPKQNRVKFKSYIPETERKLYSYSSNQPLTVKGAFLCEVIISNRTEQAEFIVIRGKGEPLLGRETAIKLGVLKIGADISAMIELKQALQQKYPEVFNGVGKLNTNQIRYYEYDVLLSTTSDKIIDSLESIFSRHGLPITCTTPNQKKLGQYGKRK